MIREVDVLAYGHAMVRIPATTVIGIMLFNGPK